VKNPLKVTIVELKPFPPETLAHLEILGLSSVSELIEQSMLGGQTTPEMLEENERRHAEYQRRKLAIIKKYGVAKQYLTPLIFQAKSLRSELSEIEEMITALQNL
jgi:hypothetical protein